jgi:hypothetical protein
MGLRFFDQFSILHFAVGVLAYFWSVSFLITIIVHILFEFIENTAIGMNLINTYFIGWWPGGKTHPDNLLNMTSDTIFSGIGWLASWWLDRVYGR